MKKKIILGVCSSIAAYKAYDLTRMFIKAGYDVHVVCTENALHLVSPLTFETLSGNQVYSESFSRARREMGHIELKDNASLYLIAPATANMLGKCAHGIADDLVSTTFISVSCPVLFAPAMNPAMWAHKAVQSNMAQLKEWGMLFIEPATGPAACGDEGQGRLADISDIYSRALEVLGA